MLDLFPLLLCGQLLSLPPAPAACPCPPPCPCRFVLPDRADRPPASAAPNLSAADLDREPGAEVRGRDRGEAAVIGTLGVTVADGETIAVVTDYATARRAALDGGHGLLVLTGPDAVALADRSRAVGRGSIVCLGPAELFPLPGVYEFRPGDLVGGIVRPAIRDPTAAGSPSSTIITRGGTRFRCGPGGCSIVP